MVTESSTGIYSDHFFFDCSKRLSPRVSFFPLRPQFAKHFEISCYRQGKHHDLLTDWVAADVTLYVGIPCRALRQWTPTPRCQRDLDHKYRNVIRTNMRCAAWLWDHRCVTSLDSPRRLQVSAVLCRFRHAADFLWRSIEDNLTSTSSH